MDYISATCFNKMFYCLISGEVYCYCCANEEIDHVKDSSEDSCDQEDCELYEHGMKLVNELELPYYLSAAVQNILESDNLDAKDRILCLKKAKRLIELEIEDAER